MILYLREDLAAELGDGDVFRAVEAIDGEIYRHKEGRKTLRFERGGRGFFLKVHQGIGWREIAKNLLQFRLPVIGAANEWRAIQACQDCGVDTQTIAGYGSRGWNPATRHSFLITDELENVESLEDFCRDWRVSPPPYGVKRVLIDRIAAISRRFHRAGINHRDFYLCHFLLGGDPRNNPDAVHSAPIYLIDLHRAQLRKWVPRRWLVKDLGSLYYSAINLGFGRRDVLRFLRGYLSGSAAQSLRAQPAFWRAVRRRAIAIHRRDYGADPRVPL